MVALISAALFFVTAGSALALHLKMVASIQIVPVALSVSVMMILFWVLATLLFGRVYCSMVCPMGIMQDIFARLPRLSRRNRFKRSYRYKPADNKLRYTWLALVVASTLAGASIMLALFDPYGAFGRVMSYLVKPLVDLSAGHEIAVGGLIGVAIAGVTLLAVAITAMRNGRAICNTVCPVGATLSIFSRYSTMGFDINTDVCVNCGLCARVCKSKCIDPMGHTVDMSRCVVCFDCVDVCDHEAINYTYRRHRLSIPMMMKVAGPQTSAGIASPKASVAEARSKVAEPTPQKGMKMADAAGAISSHRLSEATVVPEAVESPVPEKVPIDRRKFLATGLMLAAAPAVAWADDKLKRIEPIVKEHESTPVSRGVTPPGITSRKAFLSKCIGCAACIDACPARVLQPSVHEYGIAHPLHPVKDYDTSYCRYSCTRCTEVCPTGALLPLTVEEKHRTRVGLAEVNVDACVGCRLCVRRCPHDAIKMEKVNGRRVAVVTPESCIGCGSCQYICPATPIKAIKVNGIER